MTGPEHSIQITRLKIQGTRTPFSERFDDVYFAEDSGIEESRYVYLEGVDLASRLSVNPVHTIGEIGFGVGLNFLLTLQFFKSAAKSTQKLFYFSAEQFPVHKNDLVALYALYPELAQESHELLVQYPVLTPGVHTLRFCEGRIVLYLLIGSAEQMFANIDTPIQSWYWDGFAPTKNPDAFSETLFQTLSAVSAPRARGASFTSAGWVRRGLEKAGFKIEKRCGFGRKRECIRGDLVREKTLAPKTPAWFSGEKLKLADPAHDSIAVAGAGLAGSAIARVLADRGFKVTVYDPNGIATRASGNRAGLFNVQISRLPNPISRFAQAALVQFLQEVTNYDLTVDYGILRNDSGDLQAFQNSQYPEDFYSLRDDGLFLPRCGFLNPAELCKMRLTHPNITVVAQGLPEKSEASHVIYAQGADLKLADSIHHPVLDQFPVRPIRGQVLELKSTEKSTEIQTARVFHGYVTPLRPEITGYAVHILGATYQAKNIASNQEEIDRNFLMSEARRSWPGEFANLEAANVVRSREGFRLSTPDKLPLIGPLADPRWLKTNYERALKGTRGAAVPPLEVRPGEWCLLGLGSRGITFSCLGAQILASVMTGEPLPIELDLWSHLHPARFFIRNLRKNEPI
ncbi:MAG: tRNA (5-methylaminomethyl-2-thiouridine)(34)-methyltransferase MnmD [Bdellovibrionales bacterium]|nr:tRNA (5-methylaminomethyl-2-thiouridine)(34)-methyltransferase MnmD [Bdellovibrionales bacterium]